jgi:multisubunit Na+/H+ antiporter MnhF subunit
MSGWLVGAFWLLLADVPCIVRASRGDAVERLVALEAAGAVNTLAVLSLAVGFERGIYVIVAIVFALLNFVASLAFARFLERWL